MKVYTPKVNHQTMWGDITLPAGCAGIVPLAYVNGSDDVIGSSTLTIMAKVNNKQYYLVVQAGEVISPVIEGVGKITAIRDTGTRTRVILI